ncbi:MAG: cyclic nucleotide-binding domain-containing protein [Deltaproteobacteria bacterium]|nr:cyclic nucleotide-binding domain-containing protein [Deltaproteobacteria bacterium]
MINRQMEKSYKKGELILKEGTSGSAAYMINSGKVEVFRTIEGKKIVIASLGENQFFGEMSMIDDRPRSASIVAITDVEVTVIEPERFNELFYSNPEGLRAFLKDIFERLRNIDQTVIDMIVGKTASSYFGREVVLSGITPVAKKALGNTAMEIKKFPFKIGRKTENFYNDLFSHNDLYLRDTRPYNVSRNHLSIQYYQEKFHIRDRGSMLGTIVNETRIGGPVKRHEIELLRNRENIVILGSYEAPFQFKISVP